MEESDAISTKAEMEKANVQMMGAFVKMYGAMPNEQRLGVIALASLIKEHRLKAGYKAFCRSLVKMLTDGELKLE